MDLSIIIPVYNVEKYIRPCLESVFEQHLDKNFEVILVNDGTKDSSFCVIDDMIKAHSNIIVMEQENQGLSAARNTGLTKASGEYILFLDSDDLLVNDSLPLLIQKALDSTADMIVADFIKLNDEQIIDFHSEIVSNVKSKVKNGWDFFINDFNPQECYVWRTLYRRSFLEANHLRFIPGIYFEDVPFTTECYLKAEKCVRFPILFYIYRQRANSIVSSVNMKKVTDFNIVLKRLHAIKQEYSLPTNVTQKLSDTMFSAFSSAIWYLSHDKKLLARRNEYVKDLQNKAIPIKFTHGIKQRAISLLYRLMPKTYIKFRSLIPTNN